jgi:hypothetical protein
MHRRVIYRFRRAARGERSAEAIDRFPQTASTEATAGDDTELLMV